MPTHHTLLALMPSVTLVGRLCFACPPSVESGHMIKGVHIASASSVTEGIFFHAWDEESAYGILASLSQLQGAGTARYCAPYRRNCSVAALNG